MTLKEKCFTIKEIENEKETYECEKRSSCVLTDCDESQRQEPSCCSNAWRFSDLR